MRKLFFHPLVVGLALAAAACGESDLLGTHQGRVRFVLTSGGDGVAPVEQAVPAAAERAAPPSLSDDHEDGDEGRTFFQSANVTFSSVLARDLDGVLVDVAMELPVTLDVMVMDRGREIVLPDGELPPATYDQIVVVMTQVEAVTLDGTTIAITPPGGGWTAIVPVCPFVVEEGATTVVGLRLDLRRAFRWRDSRFHFQPSFVCDGG